MERKIYYRQISKQGISGKEKNILIEKDLVEHVNISGMENEKLETDTDFMVKLNVILGTAWKISCHIIVAVCYEGLTHFC